MGFCLSREESIRVGGPPISDPHTHTDTQTSAKRVVASAITPRHASEDVVFLVYRYRSLCSLFKLMQLQNLTLDRGNCMPNHSFR